MKSWTKTGLWVPLSFLLLLMLPQQLDALNSQRQKLYERDIAALAIELGINDQIQIEHVYPNAEVVLAITQSAVAENLSIFGSYPFVDLREKIGTAFNQPSQSWHDCSGHLDLVEPIKSDTQFLKVKGWLFDDDSESADELVTFVGTDNQIIGYGLTGHERPDVAAAIHRKALYAGFTGYISIGSQGRDFYMYLDSLKCKLRVEMPTL